jgi:hypothetical protein
MIAPTSSNAKARFKFTVRVKRANVEFKEGLGVGVLGTQEVAFTLPKKYSVDLLAMRVQEEADKMVEEIIEVDIEPIFLPENRE